MADMQSTRMTKRTFNASSLKDVKKETKKQKAICLASSSSHKLIIGIDLGTTFSGVSYVTSDKKELSDINIITTWPGTRSTNWKTPTIIAYARENPSLMKNKWGFEFEYRQTSYSWTKLLLDKNAAPGEFDDPALAKLADEGTMTLPEFRDAPGVLQDYLVEVYMYFYGNICRQLSEATLEITPMVTLPAIWSEQAKDATLKAAYNAGFGKRKGDKIHTIVEPEAAAIATLKQYSEHNVINAVKVFNKHPALKLLVLTNLIKPGEQILICDCGGGTVDISTYTILEVKPVLKFDELCVGVGGKCGSTYIDRNLHALLSKRFGAFFDTLPPQQKGPGSLFMSCFDKIKKSFGLDEDTSIREVYPLHMKIEESKYYDVEERTVKLSYEDMQSVFDPVVEEIVKLVNQQVTEARFKGGAEIDRIILVGGFGDSVYLNQR